MNIYTLFKIIFIVGYYLGGAECDLAKLFKDAVKQYYSGEGPPATVITIEDYVMQNTRCFMALLRNIHLQLESSEKSSQIDFQEYDHYFTTIIHLLNYDIFKYFHDDIMTIYAEMQRDKPTLDIPLIQAKVSGLIEKGTNLNMWYLETGYIHVRPEDKIVVNYKSNNNFFDECSTMYNKFKNMNEAFNKTLKKAFKTVDFRFNLIKSMPFLMSDSVQNLYDDTQMVKKDMEAEILINEILNLIIKFYGRFIVRMITDAEILLVNAYIEDKATKNFWFLENNVYLKDHIIITRDIVNRMDMIKAKYSYLIDFYKVIYIEQNKEFEKNYKDAKNKFGETFFNVLEGKDIQNESSYSMNNVGEYSDMIGYYPKHNLIKNIESDKTTMKLLNIQAWATILPVYLELSILTVRELNGGEEPVIEDKVELPNLPLPGELNAQSRQMSTAQSMSNNRANSLNAASTVSKT